VIVDQALHVAHRLALRVFSRLPVKARRQVVRAVAPTYSVGAITVMEHRDRPEVLLIRQSYRTRWGLPGGLLRKGETPTDALRREVVEEIGLDAEIVGEPMLVTEPEPRRIDVIFRSHPAQWADATRIRPQSAEIIEVRWFPTAELPELQHETYLALETLARQHPDLAAWAPSRPAKPRI